MQSLPRAQRIGGHHSKNASGVKPSPRRSRGPQAPTFPSPSLDFLEALGAQLRNTRATFWSQLVGDVDARHIEMEGVTLGYLASRNRAVVVRDAQLVDELFPFRLAL
jgi:hypothetical protein